jgi:hypothetical protein
MQRLLMRGGAMGRELEQHAVARPSLLRLPQRAMQYTASRAALARRAFADQGTHSSCEAIDRHDFMTLSSAAKKGLHDRRKGRLQSILSIVQIPEAGRQVIYGVVIISMLLAYGRSSKVAS